MRTLLEVFRQKHKKNFVLSPELQKFLFILKAFFSHNFLWTCTVEFSRSCQKMFAKIPVNFNLVSKIELVFLSKRKICHDSFPLARREQFRQPSWKYYIQSPENFRPISGSEKKQCRPKTFSHILFLWTQTMQIWHSCLRKLRPKFQKFPSKMRNTIWKVFFSKKMLPMKTMLWKRRVQFWQICQ